MRAGGPRGSIALRVDDEWLWWAGDPPVNPLLGAQVGRQSRQGADAALNVFPLHKEMRNMDVYWLCEYHLHLT